MIRYVVHDVLGNRKRYVLHSFQQTNAIVEDPENGKVCILPSNELAFDPPTEDLIRQMEQQQRNGPLPGNPGGRFA